MNGKALLDTLVALLRQFVVLPRWTAETLALWIIHTYLFKTRDVTTYIGIESPEKRCGKTTLLHTSPRQIPREECTYRTDDQLTWFEIDSPPRFLARLTRSARLCSGWFSGLF